MPDINTALYKKISSFSIGDKLTIGFGLLVGITLLIVGLGFIANLSATRNIRLVEKSREPILLAVTETHANLLKAQLYMRGYLLSGDTYDVEQYEASIKAFEENLAILKPMLAKSNAEQDAQHIAALEVIYKAWSKLPARLFELHDNPMENRLALQLSRVEVQPLQTQILEEIDDIILKIDAKNYRSPKRHTLLEDLIQFRQSLILMLGDVAAFAASGEKSFKLAYGTHASATKVLWSKVFAEHLLLSSQEVTKLNVIGDRLVEANNFAQKIFEIMESDRVFEDLYLYRTQVAPQAERIIALLGEVTSHQQKLFQQNLSQALYNLNMARIQTLIGGLIAVGFGIAMAFFLRRHIVGAVHRLTQVAKQIANGNLSQRSKVESNDEIGILATAINTMTQHLSETIYNLEEALAEVKQAKVQIEVTSIQLLATQNELVDMSRRAGMAEIASSVLHNVGNVLNNVNVSVNLIASKMYDSKVNQLAKIVKLIDDHNATLGDYLMLDEQGKRLPNYLNKLAKLLESEQQIILKEISSLTEGIARIKVIVAAQQPYTLASKVIISSVRIQDVIEDALRINMEELTRNQVLVVKDFADLPALPVDRHHILQVLVHLISNAAHAMRSTDNSSGYGRQLTLRTEGTNDINGRHLRIFVADQGEGISLENLNLIFKQGLTTRPEGHGFGLHSCILTAHEIGGTLTVHSDGLGLGATFIFDLPLDVKP